MKPDSFSNICNYSYKFPFKLCPTCFICCVLFFLQFKLFSNFTSNSLTHCLLRSISAKFPNNWGLSRYLFVLIFNFLWWEKILCRISIPLNLLRLVLCPSSGLSCSVLRVYLKSMYILLVAGVVSVMSVRSSSVIVLLKSSTLYL